MAYPAVAREGSVYHQGGLVALVHRFSSFLFLRQSLSVARESPVPEGMLLHFTFRGPAHRVISKNPIAIGGCLSLHWQVWSDEGAEPWVVEVLRWGIPDSLPLGSHLIQGSHPFTGVCLQFHQGQSSGGRGSGSADQGCLRAGSASISRLLQPVIHGYESFRGVETGHRPFHSELEDSADILQDGDTSIRSSLGSSGGLDGVSGLEGCVLAGANAPEFTQVPQVHGGGEGVPVQGTLLRLFHGSASFYQGMAPVSAILHRMGVRLRRYLDAWLLQASSREQVLFVLRTVLQLCRRLGIVVNWEKSQVIPTQQMAYLGVILDSLLSGLLLP